MQKILIIITSLVFLTGCGNSSYNTGNITNKDSSAGFSQDSGTTKEIPKDKANANGEPSDNTAKIIGTVLIVSLVVYLIYALTSQEGLENLRGALAIGSPDS